MQPSLLLGKRRESRFGEKIAQRVMPVISFLLPAKYKPVKAINVAKAMIRLVKEKQIGLSIATYNEIKLKSY
jgi:hypothetical protein